VKKFPIPISSSVSFVGGGITPQDESNTTPPNPKTEKTNILFYIQWNLGSRTPPVHEQFGSRTNFRIKNVSDDERCLGLRTRKLATATSCEYLRGSVSCWLTNLVSVYEHFGSRTALQERIKFVNRGSTVLNFASIIKYEI
jgi:hypothetical protein